jgi:hypothetical protein
MSIPLVRNNTKDAINTSIIAIKKNLERINTLLGLVDSSEPDLSGFATKQELEDTVTEINNTIDEVETSLQPVDTVTSGNMHSVTSNAVAGALSYSENEVDTGLLWINGNKRYTKAFNFTNVTFTNGIADLGTVSSLGINTLGLIRMDGVIFWSAWYATVSTFYFSAQHCYCKHQMADLNNSNCTVRFVAEYFKTS